MSASDPVDGLASEAAAAAPPPRRRAALLFIFITVALDILALGLIIPILPKLILEFSSGDSARAATLYGLFAVAFAGMQFLASPVLGALSDRFGRRPVILLSNLGLGLDYILMALAPSLWWLLVGRLLAGITAASITTANAYIADVTPPEKRAAGFGILGAAFGLGFVIGPALGGVLGSIDLRLPFWVAAALSLANFVYGWLILPESLPAEKRRPFAWRGANPLGALKFLRAHPGVPVLAGGLFLSQLAHMALPAAFVLYADYRYGWDEREVGLALALVGICSAVVQAGLVRRVIPRIGERRGLLFGLSMGAAGFALYGFASEGWILLLGVPVMALWGFAMPSAQGLLTRHVEAEAQGRLQGALTSLTGIAGIIGPLMFSQILAAAIGPLKAWNLPGAPFLLAAALLVIAALLVRARVRS
ncbi:TCR/Tet family MFS transporter [uncultured Aquimonas sp.]|uniref:TCR/Tet family MFS transporter n=1 Tax=uncultured Aquimonas sp. TaxID=385483 RepID=UPI002614037F|nr:TCR/Tet family MFS transporter [uncultured Aquimonas sp.]